MYEYSYLKLGVVIVNQRILEHEFSRNSVVWKFRTTDGNGSCLADNLRTKLKSIERHRPNLETAKAMGKGHGRKEFSLPYKTKYN
jgi:hypothetical protein